MIDLPELATVSVHNDSLMKVATMNVTSKQTYMNMIVDLPKLTALSMDGEALSGLEKFFYANITSTFYNQFCTQYNVACSPIVWTVC